MNEETLHQKTVSGKQNPFRRGSYTLETNWLDLPAEFIMRCDVPTPRMMKFEIFSKARCATENWHGLESGSFIGTVATGNLAATQTAISQLSPIGKVSVLRANLKPAP